MDKFHARSQTGERILGPDGKLLTQYPPQPELRVPVEHYENLLKRYDRAQMFLYAVRVYSSAEPGPLIDALTSDATRSRCKVLFHRRGESLYNNLLQATQKIDIAPEVHNSWWDSTSEPRPLAMQRLHRLVDVEEIASFFRLPIPVTGGFPGFPLDTGSTATCHPPRCLV